MRTPDENMLDSAVEAANHAEIISNLVRWKDQLDLLIEAGFKEEHAIKMICNMMIAYMPKGDKNV